MPNAHLDPGMVRAEYDNLTLLGVVEGHLHHGLQMLFQRALAGLSSAPVVHFKRHSVADMLLFSIAQRGPL